MTDDFETKAVDSWLKLWREINAYAMQCNGSEEFCNSTLTPQAISIENAIKDIVRLHVHTAKKEVRDYWEPKSDAKLLLKLFRAIDDHMEYRGQCNRRYWLGEVMLEVAKHLQEGLNFADPSILQDLPPEYTEYGFTSRGLDPSKFM